MKNFSIVIIFCIFSTNLYAQKIAIFKISVIFNNLAIYQEFVNQIENFKKTKFAELKKEEANLVEDKKQIEGSKLLLDENEYINQIENFNNKRNKFEKKVNKLNEYLRVSLEDNEKIILNEIAIVSKEIAIEKDIALILSNEQYYLASDSLDITDLIYEKINNSKIELKLSNYDN